MECPICKTMMVKGGIIISAWKTKEQCWDCPNCNFGMVKPYLLEGNK